MQEANDVMPRFLEYGMLNGHPLVMLKQVISQVFFGGEFKVLLIQPIGKFNEHFVPCYP